MGEVDVLHAEDIIACNYAFAGPHLESKGMRAIFQEKGKKGPKKSKIFEIWAKMYKISKYFEKVRFWLCAIIACNKLLE